VMEFLCYFLKNIHKQVLFVLEITFLELTASFRIKLKT
jgi:hypothetical protein